MVVGGLVVFLDISGYALCFCTTNKSEQRGVGGDSDGRLVGEGQYTIVEGDLGTEGFVQASQCDIETEIQKIHN